MKGTFILTPNERSTIDNFILKEEFSIHDVIEIEELASIFADALDFPSGAINNLEDKHKTVLKAALEYYFEKIITKALNSNDTYLYFKKKRNYEKL